MIFIIIGAITFLGVQILVASEFQHIAFLKGYDESKYFWWTLFLGPVGMMMVIALPQQVHTSPVEAQESEELPDI